MIIGFYHVAMFNNWHVLLQEQIQKLTQSNLLRNSDRVYITFLGGNRVFSSLPKLPKKFIVDHQDDLDLYENYTIEKIRTLSLQQEFLCYYFHTKGISVTKEKPYNTPQQIEKHGYLNLKQIKENVRNWRLLMEHFVIEKWKDAADAVQDYDCAGVNWVTAPFRHFVGNFWWSNSEYMQKLDSVHAFHYDSPFGPKETIRHRAEAWLGQNPDVRPKILYNNTANYWQAPKPEEYQ